MAARASSAGARSPASTASAEAVPRIDTGQYAGIRSVDLIRLMAWLDGPEAPRAQPQMGSSVGDRLTRPAACRVRCHLHLTRKWLSEDQPTGLLRRLAHLQRPATLLSAGDSTRAAKHIARNRVYWDEVNAPRYAAPAPGRGARQEITWGIFGISEDELHALSGDVAGMDVVELGCGTAYFGACLARRGAGVTGIDNSAEQLKTARRLQDEHDLHFPLIHGNAEDTGLPDASFDLAISEYGAIWADPYRWIPEAARILRPGGELVFLGNGTLWVLTVPETDDEGPATDRLLRPYFGIHRFDWAGQSASSSTSGTAIGSGCCERSASRCSTCSRSELLMT